MIFQVLKPFRSNGVQLERGATVELTNSPRVHQLVEARYLLPSDAEVASVAAPDTLTSPSAKRRGRPPRSENPQPAQGQD